MNYSLSVIKIHNEWTINKNRFISTDTTLVGSTYNAYRVEMSTQVSHPWPLTMKMQKRQTGNDIMRNVTKIDFN